MNTNISSDFFSWSPSYTIGNDQIDKQHQQLFELLSNVQKSLYKNDDRVDVISKTLESLMSYTQFHFTDEEQLMQEIKYTHLEGHRKLHDELINEIENLLDEVQDGEIVLVEELIVFLKNWLIKHIVEHDVKIAEFIATEFGVNLASS